MQDQLARLGQDGSFTLTTIDIQDQPPLEARYGEWVPVLMAGEDELCHYFLDEAAFQDWLAGRK